MISTSPASPGARLWAMSVFTIGGGAGEPPFNRTFFNVTLSDLVERGPDKEKEKRLTLFLTDGSTLDVCAIDELTDQYVALRNFTNGDDACATALQLIPYALIYRVEITPRAASEHRVGFHYTPAKRATSRRGVKP
jgi:hypothetical protein